MLLLTNQPVLYNLFAGDRNGISSLPSWLSLLELRRALARSKLSSSSLPLSIRSLRTMADYERRNSNYRGGGRKRRYRGKVTYFGFPGLIADHLFLDDEDYDRRPQRRRYEEPLFVQVRRQLLTIAESVRTYMSPTYARGDLTCGMRPEC